MRKFFKILAVFIGAALTCGFFYLYLNESIDNIKAETAFNSGRSAQVTAPLELEKKQEELKPAAINSVDLPKSSGTPSAISETPKPLQWRIIESDENYNNQLQYYCAGNVSIEGKRIVIASLKESKHGRDYTSGKVESNHSYLYGKFSFVIKPAQGRGLFPAIWMLPIDFEAYPEIDIFEMIGSEPQTFYGVIHYLDDGAKSRDYFKIKTEPKEQYKVGLEWEKGRLAWYLDDVCVYETSKGVPDEPMYLIINQAIGGDWPGDPDDTTEFPAYFIVESWSIEPEWSDERW